MSGPAVPRSVRSPAGPAGAVPFDAEEIRWGPEGLVPVIAQDVRDGRVLMLAYADREAIDATIATGEAHFHSRSRGRLWHKGETSGNVLRVVSLALDCDGDTVLAGVEPAGPVCHRGTGTCFDPDAAGTGSMVSPQGFAWLETLWTTLEDRVATRPDGSYTARLVAAGPDATGRKVVEEATEVLIAAKDDAVAQASGTDQAATRASLASEAADLLFHLLVALAERGIAPAAAIDVLRARHGRPHRGGAAQPDR